MGAERGLSFRQMELLVAAARAPLWRSGVGWCGVTSPGLRGHPRYRANTIASLLAAGLLRLGVRTGGVGSYHVVTSRAGWAALPPGWQSSFADEVDVNGLPE